MIVVRVVYHCLPQINREDTVCSDLTVEFKSKSHQKCSKQKKNYKKNLLSELGLLKSRGEAVGLAGCGWDPLRVCWNTPALQDMGSRARSPKPLPITSAVLDITHSFTACYQAKNERQSAENVKLSEH